jgi:arylformamidase
MDQQQLDDAYDQAVYAPNRDQVHHRRHFNSARARAVLGEPLRFSYGPSQFEGLDVYRTKRTDAPVAVYIHGGAWRSGRSAEFAFLAELFVNAGANLAVLDFANIDDVGGDLMAMAKQVRAATAWVYKNAQQFGADPNRLYVCGHSSGGHLAGVVATTDWQKDFALPKDVLKGAMLASGMYDLKAVRLSNVQIRVFTDEIEQGSPRNATSTSTVGDPRLWYDGTPEFQRRARHGGALKAAGKPVTFLVGGLQPFRMLETLAAPYGLLGRPVLEMMAG